jgi:hypothetical protein
LGASGVWFRSGEGAMKTAYALIILAFSEYLDPSLPMASFETREDCEAVGVEHVKDLAEMVREKSGGDIGSVWFHCQEVRGMGL